MGILQQLEVEHASGLTYQQLFLSVGQDLLFCTVEMYRGLF